MGQLVDGPIVKCLDKFGESNLGCLGHVDLLFNFQGGLNLLLLLEELRLNFLKVYVLVVFAFGDAGLHVIFYHIHAVADFIEKGLCVFEALLIEDSLLEQSQSLLSLVADSSDGYHLFVVFTCLVDDRLDESPNQNPHLGFKIHPHELVGRLSIVLWQPLPVLAVG